MPLEAGTRLGPYEITALVGTGGTAEVYRARDTRLDREVAVKVLSAEERRDPEALRRFEREARVASALKHPNIITIHDVGGSGAMPYIAMELVDGETLRDRLTRGPLPLAEVLALARQIAKALAVAHEAGIVHRDLKPQNVMIDRESVVKVLDFGLGKPATPVPGSDRAAAATATADEAVTAAGRIIGSAPYMSPEQVRGGPLAAQSDQFAFGLMLYEMLAGARAFRRDTIVQTLSAIIEAEPEPLEARAPDVPARLCGIVARCLHKTPSERYASTRDLARDLEDVERDIQTGALAGAWLRQRRHAGRRGIAVAGAIAVAVAAVSIWRLRPPVAPPPAPRPPTQLVVLPFTNVGGDPANQALSDGLVELLTTSLTQFERFQHALMVVPASEVRRERLTSAREARQTFSATLVVSGSVQRSGDTVRLTINLIDPVTLRQMRARSMAAPLAEVARLQDEAVAEVGALLDVQLDQSARSLLERGASKTPEAYAFYVQGRGYLQRYDNLDNVDQAIQLFTRALAADPRYALARAAIAEAYWRRYDATKDPQWIARARVEGDEAVRIDSGLSPVHVTLGIVARGTGKYEEAVLHLERALTLDSTSGDAYRELAQAYSALGRHEAAEATYKRAMQVRPNDWSIYGSLGAFYSGRARYEEAASQFRRVIELTPDNARGYTSLGAVYYYLKQFEAAAAMLERSVSIRPSAPALSNLGTLYFAQRRYADAASAFERALKIDARDYRVWRNLASAYHWAPGQRERARAAFEKAAALAEQELGVNRRQASVLAALADCYSMTGRADRARALAREAVALAPADAAVLFTVAVVHEQLGERRPALETLARAIDAGYALELIERSPSLAALRQDPGYARLTRRTRAGPDQ